MFGGLGRGFPFKRYQVVHIFSIFLCGKGENKSATKENRCGFSLSGEDVKIFVSMGVELF